jgi:hypothetical protein
MIRVLIVGFFFCFTYCPCLVFKSIKIKIHETINFPVVIQNLISHIKLRSALTVFENKVRRMFEHK